MVKIAIGVVIFLAFIMGIVYFVGNQANTAPLVSNSPTPLSPTTSPVSASPDNNTLLAGGNSYLDPKGVYSLLYPNDYKMDTQNNGQFTRFYKLGPSQKGQTEMYDGVNLNFETVDLGNQTLSEWVDTQIKNSTSDGTVRLTQPKKEITLNGYKGFTYQTQGLGEATYIVLQKDQASKYAVNIIYVFYDPKNQGFEKEIDSILNSLQILK